MKTDTSDADILKAVALWLDPVDLSNDLCRAQAKQCPNTGLWLLDHDLYKA